MLYVVFYPNKYKCYLQTGVAVKVVSYIFFFHCFRKRIARTMTTERKRVKQSHKPYSCNHCGTRFLRKTSLNIHIKKFHERSTIKGQVKSTALVPENVTEVLNYSYEDWTDPDISLDEPLREQDSNTDSELENSRNEEDCVSIVNDLIISESDSDLVQENKAKKAERPSDIQIEIEAEKPQDLSKLQKEKAVENAVCIDAIQEKVSEVGGEDKREIRGIYEGRLYSKRTAPIRVMVPKRQSTRISSEKDEDINETELKLKDCSKKRLVLKCPCGKRMKLDIQLK